MPQPLSNLGHLDLPEWLKQNCQCSSQLQANDLPWSIQFLFAVWSLWRHKNSVVFDNTPLNANLHKSCIQLAAEYFYCVGKLLRSKQYSAIPVRWHKPDEGWFKLNSDGASIGNLGSAGGGELIHDHNGNWVKGYMRNIGVATSIIAEFWALRDGFRLASQMGITHLIVELDAKVIVDLILSSNTSNRAYTPLLNDCRYLLSHFQCYKINRVYQELNRCVDLLAKEACSCLTAFVVLDNPHLVSLCSILDSDAFGLYSLRLLASTLPILAF